MLSKTTLYVLRALSVLGKLEAGTYLGASTIGKQLDIPANYLSKMLQSLAKKGHVVSQKGLGGGFRLAFPPEQVTLFEIIKAIDEEELPAGCFWGNAQCPLSTPCSMHDKWKQIVELTHDTFNTTTLADLMQKARE